MENERCDGYDCDQCVFGDRIDIYDSMQVLVGYQNGVSMTYSLNAFMPWEGYIVALNGSLGRIDVR